MKKDYQTGWFERCSYEFYFLGQLFSYGIVAGFLTLFMTESGIPAFVVSGILLVAKIWDAVNDPLFGIVVDKAHLKGGKYKPWLKLSTILIAVTTILIFVMPQHLGVPLKAAWILVAYILWDAAYTMCDVPIFALATTMTNNIKERDSMYLIKGFFTFVGGLIVIVLIPFMYPTIGWGASAVILALAGMVFMFPIGFVAKERHNVEKEVEPSIKELLKYLLNNKPLLVFYGASIIACLTSTGGTVSSYVAIYCLGSEKWISYLTLLSTLPMLVSILAVQLVLKKVDKFTIWMIANFANIALSILQYFMGYGNITALCVVLVIKSIFTSGAGVLGTMFTADCAEYGHFRSGMRAQGMAFSIQTFTAKITGALSGAIGMFILGLIGFVEGSGAAQTPETIRWFWKLWTIVPVISGTIAAVFLLLAYKLPSQDAKIMAKANAGEITREEAIAQLKYKGYDFSQ
ncbi:MAG: MFS transporter [Firmicutes bacterium]|nr:MFS transporter [Bacillota bacterium]